MLSGHDSHAVSLCFNSHPLGCLTLRAMLRIVSPKLRFGGVVKKAVYLEAFLTADFMRLSSFPIHPRQASKMLAPHWDPFAFLRISA